MIRIALSVLLVLGAVAALEADETLVLRSGNGEIGQTDLQITLLAGPADSAFPAPFEPADFAAALAGPAAPIIANHGAWIPALPADPLAKWISTSPSGAGEGGSALYAQPFALESATIGSAALDVYFAVDNGLGGGPNTGVFLNGLPVPGTTGGTFGGQYSFLGLDVGALLQPGPNTLFVNASDWGGPGGLLYSATLTVVEGQTAGAAEAPAGFRLSAARPNPFNPSTTLEYSLDATADVRLSVHDALGREVAVLENGLRGPGEHRAVFDGAGLASGLYLAVLESGGRSQSRKLLLLK